MSELGTTFREEGGPYVWVRLAFGKFPAAVSTLFYWITNPIWLGGSLAFISATTWDAYIHPLPEGSVGDSFFKLAFIWLAITTAIVGLQYGKWVINAGAVVKVLLVLVFVVTVAIYAVKNGVHGYAVGISPPPLPGSWVSYPCCSLHSWVSRHPAEPLKRCVMLNVTCQWPLHRQVRLPSPVT